MVPVQRQQLILIYILLWVAIALVHCLFLYFAYGLHFLSSVADSLVFNVLYAFLGLGIWQMVRYSGMRRSMTEMTIQHITGITISTLIYVSAGPFFLRLILSHDAGYLRFLEQSVTIRAFSGGMYYIILTAIFYLILNYRELQQQKEREAQFTAQLREAELSMLRSQIRPHFLFNSLNSISSLTLTSAEKAQEMIIKLSEFMRYSLNFPDESMSTLERELYHIQLYLDIEKVRFGEKLDFVREVDDKCLAIPLPAMILQPIIENAVKYGVHESTGKNRLLLRTLCDSDYLKITIQNDYDPDAVFKKGTGTGLNNVAKRMQTAYGTKNLVKIHKENNIFTVELRIPVHV
jgi:sensor histidine kinase YesM